MVIDATLNLPTIITIVSVVIGGVIWLVRLEGRVNSTSGLSLKIEAMAALDHIHASQLAEYKIHVAETYVTKQGMQEQTKQIMDAIKDVAGRVDSLGSRLDSIVDRKDR